MSPPAPLCLQTRQRLSCSCSPRAQHPSTGEAALASAAATPPGQGLAWGSRVLARCSLAAAGWLGRAPHSATRHGCKASCSTALQPAPQPCPPDHSRPPTPQRQRPAGHRGHGRAGGGRQRAVEGAQPGPAAPGGVWRPAHRPLRADPQRHGALCPPAPPASQRCLRCDGGLRVGRCTPPSSRPAPLLALLTTHPPSAASIRWGRTMSATRAWASRLLRA